LAVRLNIGRWSITAEGQFGRTEARLSNFSTTTVKITCSKLRTAAIKLFSANGDGRVRQLYGRVRVNFNGSRND
jgi:hypothetical protein